MLVGLSSGSSGWVADWFDDVSAGFCADCGFPRVLIMWCLWAP